MHPIIFALYHGTLLAVITVGGGDLLPPSEERPGMLLDILQSIGEHQEKGLSVNSAKVEKPCLSYLTAFPSFSKAIC